jgi:hypothetical protein
MALTDEQVKFVLALANEGSHFADQYKFPIAAVVACGFLESRWGTSEIFKLTNCPFNLQRPSNWQFPKCDLVKLPTFKDRAKTQRVFATFCKAVDLRDSVRLFCEWIDHYPLIPARTRMIAAASSAHEFAKNLPLVGFGASLGGTNPGIEYAKACDVVAPIIACGY